MPRDGNGNYIPPNGSWTTGVGNGVDATITDWSALLSDLSNALSQSMSKDGQTSFTNHIPFGTKRATNLGDPVSSQDAVTLSYMASYVASASVTNSTNLGGHPSSWYQQALGYTPVNKAGDTITGDLTVYRNATPTIGIIYLNQAKTRYLSFDGTSYNLQSADLVINDGTALRSNNIKTVGSTSIIGSGDISTGVSNDHGYNNIGSLCTCCVITSAPTPLSPGGVIAGSLISPCSVNAGDGIRYSGTGLPGTWRILGYYSSESSRFLALFQRIA